MWTVAHHNDKTIEPEFSKSKGTTEIKGDSVTALVSENLRSSRVRNNTNRNLSGATLSVITEANPPYQQSANRNYFVQKQPT